MQTKLNRRDRKDYLIVIAVTAVMLAVMAAAGLLFYRYTNNRLYDESIAQLNEINNQLFEKLEIQINLQWGYLEKFESFRTDSGQMTTEELTELLKHAENDLGPSGKTILLRAIDSDGYYYTDEGRQGLWTGLDKLDDDDDDGRQSFLIANWLDNENYMAFALQPSQPLVVDGHRITYFVLLRSMTDMQPYFHSSAFGENNLLYIVDIDGFTLFYDGEIEGFDVEGRNIFSVLENEEFPHEESFESFLNDCMTGGRHSTDVIINGKTLYVTYDVMPEYDWGVFMIVSSEDVAASATEMVSSLMNLFIVIIVLVLVAALISFLFIYRFQSNKKLLDLKEENELLLEETNRRLELANSDLAASQLKTQEALDVATNATRAKSQFLANMSHDIRTPMNAIVGIAKLMENDVNNPDTMRYYIGKLQHSSKYMLGLINDILDMSKIESGEVHLNLEHVKIAEQAGQIESIIRSQSSEKNQTFTVIVHQIVHEYLIGDSIRIRQIFINLLNNAVKYTQDGGEIHFEITELPCDVPGSATIKTSVIDNGYGMKADFVEHIFEPFVREENSMTNKVQGTGLGMSITKSLVDMMGGTITVQSEEGKGSRFDVTLTMPIDTDAVYDPGVSSVLLLADDDVLIGNVSAAFSEEPVELRVAATVDDAVAQLKEKPAEAIVMSGYLASDELEAVVTRLRDAEKDALLVFCCDYAHRDRVRRTIAENKLDGFISRPFFLENLIVAVKNARRGVLDDDNSKHSPLAGKHFLCAEDNELNAEILEALLKMNGATCTIYPSGVELLEAFANVKPGDYDAILMDVQMPRMNGIEATKAIRKSNNPLGRSIPIIAMTANAFSSDVQECLDAGMDAHLAKPLDINALERTLHDLTSENTVGGGSSNLGKKAFSMQRG